MQINVISTVKATKSKAVSPKDAKKGDFEKALKEAEKNGSSALAQLLAAYGIVTAAVQQQTPDGKDCGTQTLTGSLGDVSTLPGNLASGVVPESLDGLLQMPAQKLLITNATVLPGVTAKGTFQSVETQQVGMGLEQVNNENAAQSSLTAEAQTAEAQIPVLPANEVQSAAVKVPDLAAPTLNTVQTVQNQNTQNTISAQSSILPQINSNDMMAQTQIQTTVIANQPGSAADSSSLKTDGTSVPNAAVQTTVQAAVPTVKQAENPKPDTGGSKQDTNKDSNITNQVFSIQQADTTSTGDNKIPEPVKTDVANQLADAVKQAVDSGRTEVKMHLSPEELGGISIKIVSQGGTLSLQIAADSQRTGELLASNMHELTQAIQDQGITMNHTEVTYAGAGGFDAAASQQQNQQNFGGMTPKWTTFSNTSPVFGISNTADTAPESAVDTKSYASGLSILA